LDNESSELVQFVDAVSTVERAFDFIVIDTPGSDTYLMRLAHAMADTLVTAPPATSLQPSGNWTRERVTTHRSHHKIPVFRPTPDGNCSAAEVST
jgi:hypothetical protein